VHSFVDFYVGVACNTNASDVYKIRFTYLLTYLLPSLGQSHDLVVPILTINYSWALL